MVNSVVVGVDGSETARRAAEAARDLAVAMGANLHVVTAFITEWTEVVGSGSDQAPISSRATAENIARELALELNSNQLQVAYFAALGSPADALIKHAEQHDAALIVVGNRRMRGFGRILGSVANSVAHNAPCDVYVVKTDEA